MQTIDLKNKFFFFNEKLLSKCKFVRLNSVYREYGVGRILVVSQRRNSREDISTVLEPELSDFKAGGRTELGRILE